MKYLGIDFGTKKVGLAFGIKGDGLSQSAIPIGTIVLKDWDGAVSDIVAVMLEYNVSCIVLGNPKDQKDNDTQISADIKKFKRFLELRIKKPVVLYNERLSTKDSIDYIKETGDNKYDLDSVSAAFILERYFDSLEN